MNEPAKPDGNGPLLEPEDLDQLGQALLTLTQELWVLKDRQRVLEALLDEAGLLDPAKIDAFEPGPALAGQLRDERQALIDNVLNALARPSFDKADR